MPWQLAILISLIAITATSLVRRHHSQNSQLPSSLPPALSYLFGVAPLGLVAGLLLPHSVTWNSSLIILLIFISITAAFANWFTFRATKQIPATRLRLIGQSQIIMIITLGWLILGEGLNFYQIVAAGFLLTAAILAVMAPTEFAKKSQKNKIPTSAVILALMGGFVGATSLVAEKAALGHMDIGAYLIFGYSAQTLGLLILASKDLSKSIVHKLTYSEIKWAALMGITNGFGGVMYVVALVGSNNISLIVAMTSFGLPLLALGAFVFLKEKENHKLLWASLVLGFIGLLIGALR